jgi:hypothetical protein
MQGAVVLRADRCCGADLANQPAADYLVVASAEIGPARLDLEPSVPYMRTQTYQWGHQACPRNRTATLQIDKRTASGQQSHCQAGQRHMFRLPDALACTSEPERLPSRPIRDLTRTRESAATAAAKSMLASLFHAQALYSLPDGVRCRNDITPAFAEVTSFAHILVAGVRIAPSYHRFRSRSGSCCGSGHQPSNGLMSVRLLTSISARGRQAAWSLLLGEMPDLECPLSSIPAIVVDLPDARSMCRLWPHAMSATVKGSMAGVPAWKRFGIPRLQSFLE